MFYKDARKSVSIGIAITVLGASLTLLGCNSSKRSENARTTKQSSSAAANSTAPDIDLNCVINHIQNPPESFHYSFTDVSDNPWQEEAEVTPQSINGTFTNNSLPTPQSFHGTPQEVSSNLHAIGRMASLFALVRGPLQEHSWSRRLGKRHSLGHLPGLPSTYRTGRGVALKRWQCFWKSSL
jgi:hypothetical protein